MVDLLDDDEDLEVEIATSLLYPHCHYSYRQLRGAVAALGEARRNEMLKLGAAHRGRHDELLRAFQLGAWLPLRHPDGHWRLPRHASPPPLRAADPGVHATCTATRSRCARGSRRWPRPGSTARTRLRWRRRLQAYRALRDSGEPEARAERAVSAAAGHALPRDVQDGLRRGAVYRGAALAAWRGTSAIAAWRGRCIARSRCGIRRWRGCSGSRM